MSKNLEIKLAKVEQPRIRRINTLNKRPVRSMDFARPISKRPERLNVAPLQVAEELATQDLTNLRDRLRLMVATAGQGWAFGEHKGLLIVHHLPFTIRTSSTVYRLRSTIFRRLHPNLAALMSGVLLFSLLVPVFNVKASATGYDLSKANSLLTATAKDLQSKLTFDAGSNSYGFNTTNPSAELSGQTGTSSSIGGLTYSAKLPVNLTQDSKLTLTDISAGLNTSLTPEFPLGQGKEVDHHIVYPLEGQNGQLVYTPQGAGLKEDILLYANPGMAAQFAYKLNLPAGFTANQTAAGGLNIVGANPNTGQAVTYQIPAPVVKGAKGVKAMLKYSDGTLTVWALGLDKANYPLDIDPSFIMSSTNCGWDQGVNESGNANIATGCSLSRSSLTGGSVGTATQQTSAFTSARDGHSSVVYNGYLYIVGGSAAVNATGCNASGLCNDIQYCPLNTNGSVGTCTQQLNAFTTPRSNHTSVAYNGYLYIIGGSAAANATGCNASGICGDIQYCPIHSNGSVGTCTQQLNAYTIARDDHSSVVYNGYLYIMGGTSTNASGGDRNDIQHCLIKADGSIGTCTNQTSAFTTARETFSSAVYNGYIYIIAGLIWGGTYLSDIQYCPINTDGSVGSCTTSSNGVQGAPRYAQSSVAYNGYLYTMGGQNSGGSSLDDIQYCPINANGTIGACVQQTTAFAPARQNFASIAYNGYVYLIGGLSTVGGTGCNASSVCNDIIHAKVDPAGALQPFTQDGSNIGTSKAQSMGVVVGNYVYSIGGCTSVTNITCNTTTNTVNYAPITNGVTGTWATTTATPADSLADSGVATYNGYIYIISGHKTSTSTINNVYYAQPGSTGNITGWTTVTAPTGLTGSWGLASVAYDGFLYIFGGCTTAASTCSNYTTTVSYTALNASTGALSTPCAGNTFCSLTGFTTARFGLDAVLNGDRVYLTGGYSGSTQNDIQYARLSSSGGLLSDAGCGTTWCTDSSTFTTGRFYHASAVINSVLYIGGGYTSTGAAPSRSDFQFAQITSSGALASDSGCGSTWCTTQSFPSVIGAPGYAASQGSLYILGGAPTANTVSNKSYYAIANNNGSGGIGGWTSATSLPGGVQDATSVTYNGYIYEIGGGGLAVGYALICTGGNNGSDGCGTTAGPLGTTWHTTTNLPAAIADATSVVNNGYIYVIGGDPSGTASANVYYATICTANNNGIDGCTGTAGPLGTTWHSVTSLPTATYNATSVVANGYIYEMGGCTTSCGPGGVVTSVYYALICTGSNSGTDGCTSTPGTLGTTWHSATSLTNATKYATSVAYNGYVYEIGGCTSSCGPASSVYYAQVNSNGTLGSWNRTSDLFTAVAESTAIAYNGYLYQVGGCVSTGACGTTTSVVQYASFNSNGTLGGWNSTTSLTTGTQKLTSVVANGFVYEIGGCTGTCSSPSITVKYGDLAVMSQMARYSIELATDKTTNPVNYFIAATNESLNSNLTIAYATATIASPTFGSSTSTSGLVSGTKYPVSIGASDGKAYYWLTINIDDTQSMTFGGDTPTTVSYLQLNYHPNPSTMLLGGQTFNGGSLQSLDAP